MAPYGWVGIAVAFIIAVFGFLIRRSLYDEIDLLKTEIRELWTRKMERGDCLREMEKTEGSMKELKDLTKENHNLLVQVAIDIAVLKSKMTEVTDRS